MAALKRTGTASWQMDPVTIARLKNSTKHLLRLMEEIQTKTSSSRPIPEDSVRLGNMLNLDIQPNILSDIEETDNNDKELGAAMERLDIHTKNLDSIEIQNEDDDCSVYKKLTRKCLCMNRREFNDFVIHFNEDVRSCTGTVGEIIKNLKILKRFLYMGGGYTKNSLLFLNEGLQKSTHNEKVDIALGCSHADICNVFDDDSIVNICIACVAKLNGDNFTKLTTADFLCRLALVEEGRRYLNFSTKISNDIKRVLKKKTITLREGTISKLQETLDLLNPSVPKHINVTYYSKAEEGTNPLDNPKSLSTVSTYTTLDSLSEFWKNINNSRSVSEKLEVPVNDILKRISTEMSIATICASTVSKLKVLQKQASLKSVSKYPSLTYYCKPEASTDTLDISICQKSLSNVSTNTVLARSISKIYKRPASAGSIRMDARINSLGKLSTTTFIIELQPSDEKDIQTREFEFCRSITNNRKRRKITVAYTD